MSKLRYYREKFDPRQARPFRGQSSEFATVTSDGVRISGTRLPSAAESDGGASLGFIVVHGLFAHRRLPSLLELAESLTRFGPVWTMDLRGHGTSGGACTLGEREALDVAAVTAFVRRETPLPVVILGLSLGAAAAIRSAALIEPADGVIAISGPSQWQGRRGFAAWKTALVWRVPGGPAATQLVTGVRLSATVPTGLSPADAISGLAPAPVLIVHGTKDLFFPPQEAEDLYRRAGQPKDLWIIPGGGHAEGLFCLPGRLVERPVVDAFANELQRRLFNLMGPTSQPGPEKELLTPAATIEGRTAPPLTHLSADSHEDGGSVSTLPGSHLDLPRGGPDRGGVGIVSTKSGRREIQLSKTGSAKSSTWTRGCARISHGQ